MKNKLFSALLCMCVILLPACAKQTAMNKKAESSVSPLALTALAADDGLENKRGGWIYYEDFSERSEVPVYLDADVKGLGRAEIEDGALRATVINGGTNDHVFFNYPFEEALDGKITVETCVRTDSLAFANLLFFFCETDDFYSTQSVITNVAVEGGYFKNNSGSGWSSLGVACSVGEWHDVRMVLDTNSCAYQLTVDGFTVSNVSFRKNITGASDAIRYLRFGSQTAWADVSYKYIRIREATAEDIVRIDYTNDFDGNSVPQDMSYSFTGGGSADFSEDGLVTLKTPTSGTVSVSKTFESALSGEFTAEVRFSNGSSYANTFANVLFLENSAYSGTAANIVTCAIESGILRYHYNGAWKPVMYNSAELYLVDGEWYVLKASVNTTTHKTKLYISGEHYINGAGGSVLNLGEDVYLGEYDFRNSSAGNPDKIEIAIGTGKANTVFTVDYIKIYSTD